MFRVCLDFKLVHAMILEKQSIWIAMTDTGLVSNKFFLGQFLATAYIFYVVYLMCFIFVKLHTLVENILKGC